MIARSRLRSRRLTGRQGSLPPRDRRKRRVDGHGDGEDADAGRRAGGGRESRGRDGRDLARGSADEAGRRHSARSPRRRAHCRRQVHPGGSVGHVRAREAEGRRPDGRIEQGEGTFFNRQNATAEQFTNQSKQRLGELADQFLKLYPASSNEEAVASSLKSFSDEANWHMRIFAEAQAKLKKPKA